MKTWVQAGRMKPYTLVSGDDIKAGDVKSFGTLVGVASTSAVYDADEEKVVEFALVGVYKMSNAGSISVADGAEVRVDEATQEIVASGGTVVGAAFEASNGILDVPVLLKGGSGVASGM